MVSPPNYHSIESLTQNSLEEVAALHQKCFLHPWPLTSFQELLKNPFVQGWICRDSQSSEIIGLILVQCIAEEAEIYTIATHPDYRRQKIASTLIEFFQRQCVNNEIKMIYLEVDWANSAAANLYHKLGFESFGRREKYYCDENGIYTDALLLKLRLN